MMVELFVYKGSKHSGMFTPTLSDDKAQRAVLNEGRPKMSLFLSVDVLVYEIDEIFTVRRLGSCGIGAILLCLLCITLSFCFLK